jgi:hypothetical protein
MRNSESFSKILSSYESSKVNSMPFGAPTLPSSEEPSVEVQISKHAQLLAFISSHPYSKYNYSNN